MKLVYYQQQLLHKASSSHPHLLHSLHITSFYFSFYYHTRGYYPGTACVYMLNDRLEIIGRYADDDLDCYRSCLILPTADGGCVTVNDSCNYYSVTSKTRPVIKKLRPEDFETLPLSISHDEHHHSTVEEAYPNPCDEKLFIPVTYDNHPNIRCQVTDRFGRVVIDRIAHGNSALELDVSRLKTGVYHYRIYTDEGTLLTEKFIKK